MIVFVFAVVLSKVLFLVRQIFNNSIRAVSQQTPSNFIEPYIDANYLSYANDILLMADSLDALKNAVDVVCSGLNEIGLSVANFKTEFLILGPEIASIQSKLVPLQFHLPVRLGI